MMRSLVCHQSSSRSPGSTVNDKPFHSTPDFDSIQGDGQDGPEIFASEPFASGSCRYAYAGKVICGERAGTKIVVKKWKSQHIFDHKFWSKDLECHRVAKLFVDAWNSRRIVSKRYTLSVPWKSTCTTPCVVDIGKNKVQIHESILCEEWIPGQFTKWNSNTGYVARGTRDASVHAFCHWTYHHSRGKYLMCDAQGTKDKDAYHLTDPCVLSIDKRFGETDIGPHGIQSFFETHVCNKFCQKSWIKPKTSGKGKGVGIGLKRKKNTIYRWQMRDHQKNQNRGGGAMATIWLDNL